MFYNCFPKTTYIIDCTEFFIEKPSTPTAQSQTYSSYKHKNTFKALVAIYPNGAFTYVSWLWGGNVSDCYITQNSGFLDLIRPGDEVMTDRGFPIRDLLLERRATLNIPPFTQKCAWGKGKRLSNPAIRKTKSIAKLRIHVESAIGRLKIIAFCRKQCLWTQSRFLIRFWKSVRFYAVFNHHLWKSECHTCATLVRCV